MTLAAWLDGRRPAPPEPLEAALRRVEGAWGAARGARDGGSTALADELASAGRERLELALARSGRERESAYRLLEADALFTYACEAALERSDAALALRRILAIASG